MDKTEFEFKGFTWIVRKLNGELVYRDKAHLGGPWSSAVGSMNNSTIDSKFRRLLKEAVEKLS